MLFPVFLRASLTPVTVPTPDPITVAFLDTSKVPINLYGDVIMPPADDSLDGTFVILIDAGNQASTRPVMVRPASNQDTIQLDGALGPTPIDNDGSMLVLKKHPGARIWDVVAQLGLGSV